MTTEIVVARYQEDISWLNKIHTFDNKIVYNKYDGNNLLDNVGREGHTYLYHIIKNYNNLADYTLFCQGDPVFHQSSFIDDCNDIDMLYDFVADNGIYFFGMKNIESIYSIKHKTHPLGLPLYYFLDLLFDMKVNENDRFTITYGAQFFISKHNILNRPLKFYEFLIKFLSTEKNPIEGYIFERIWCFIFSQKIKLSPKYLIFA